VFIRRRASLFISHIFSFLYVLSVSQSATKCYSRNSSLSVCIAAGKEPERTQAPFSSLSCSLCFPLEKKLQTSLDSQTQTAAEKYPLYLSYVLFQSQQHSLLSSVLYCRKT
jgi:hypothetical protein